MTRQLVRIMKKARSIYSGKINLGRECFQVNDGFNACFAFLPFPNPVKTSF